MSTYVRLSNTLFGHMGIEPSRITPEIKIKDIIHDPDDMIDLEFALEQEFQVEVRLDKLENNITIEGLAKAIDGLLEKKP